MITAVTERLRQPAMIFTRFYPFVRISMSNIRFMMKTNIYHCQTLETRIAKIDAALQERLNGKDCTFINLAPQLTHKDGTIDHSLFRDGLHPNAEGYKRIAKVLKGYL